MLDFYESARDSLEDFLNSLPLIVQPSTLH